jgi:hypothetical protein
VDEQELKLIAELTSIEESGVPFYIERVEDQQLVVMLGPSISEPLAMMVTDDLARGTPMASGESQRALSPLRLLQAAPHQLTDGLSVH